MLFFTSVFVLLPGCFGETEVLMNEQSVLSEVLGELDLGDLAEGVVTGLTKIELSPGCADAINELWAELISLQLTLNPDSKYYWMNKATGGGNLQYGLIDTCFANDFEYCTVSHPIENGVQGAAGATNGLTGFSGCCMPKECAYDERDASIRVALCDPKLALVQRIGQAANDVFDLEQILAAAEIPPDMVSHISDAIVDDTNYNALLAPTCGYGEVPATTGTYVMWAIIGILAFTVLVTSLVNYFVDLYGDEKTSEFRLPKALEVFAFQESWKTLTDRPARSTNFLDGIRAFSFFWVVFGHSFIGGNFVGIMRFDNMMVAMEFTKSWQGAIFLLSAYFSIDTFLWMGGFLFAYIFARKLQKMKNPLRKTPLWAPMIFITRWLRLTPVVLFVILFASKVLPTLNNAPALQSGANALQDANKECDKYIWQQLLYITTLFTTDHELLPFEASGCQGELWYLSSEFVMVWLTPFAFAAYVWRPVAGFVVTTALCLVGILSTLVISFKYEVDFMGNNWGKYYFSPWTRCISYYVGLGCGLLFNFLERKAKERNSKVTVSIALSNLLQLLMGAVLLPLILSQLTVFPDGLMAGTTWTTTHTALFNAFCRPLWSVGLSLLAFSLMYQEKRSRGIINGFLSMEMWGPIGKLSFGGYVMHQPLYQFRGLKMVGTEHFSLYEQLALSISIVVQSLGAAFLIWILIEAPFAKLAKMLMDLCFGGRKRTEKDQQRGSSVNRRSSIKKVLETIVTSAPRSSLKLLETAATLTNASSLTNLLEAAKQEKVELKINE